MNKEQIIKATTDICEVVEKIVGNKEMTVDVGCILTGDNIDDYKIESINKSRDNKISICIKFHAIVSNTWHGKYYFVIIE